VNLWQTSVALALALVAGAAAADDAARIDALEQRVEYLEDELARTRGEWRAAEAGDDESWADRVSLSGSVELGHYDGQEDSVTSDAGYRIFDARLFVDAELGDDIRVGERLLVRNLGFTGELSLVRLGEEDIDVGDLYVDLQGIGGSPWLNLRPGRFQAPVGEGYHRYGRDAARDPFITNPLGAPWWWDEGVMLYGGSAEGALGYVASVTNGETPSDFDDGSGEQVTLKLWTQPLPWLYVSASGVTSGEIGAGTGALWLGESWAVPMGEETDVPTLFRGAEQADATSGYDRTWLLGGDVVLTPVDYLRIWLAYGQYEMDAADGSAYDRTLHYWIAEAVLRGAVLGPRFAPGYVGLRADALGTFDGNRGFLLDWRYGEALGFNMESFEAWTAVVGWQLGRHAILRAEYSLRDVELVRGATPALRDAAEDADVFSVELGVQF
jgi:hypothetical protein